MRLKIIIAPKNKRQLETNPPQNKFKKLYGKYNRYVLKDSKKA